MGYSLSVLTICSQTKYPYTCFSIPDRWRGEFFAPLVSGDSASVSVSLIAKGVKGVFYQNGVPIPDFPQQTLNTVVQIAYPTFNFLVS